MMGITVREALQLPSLKDAVLVAGAAGLDRLITSVNIMEVPYIAKFVKQNELLLTTAFPIKDDLEIQASLVPTLANQGLAAVAIKPVELWFQEIPQTMVQQAEEMAFPLIQLPGDASFNEIINPILGEILNRQATVLLRSEEVHRALTGIVLDGGGLAEIAHMLASLLQAPVSIHNAKLRLLAYCGPSPGQTPGAGREDDLVRELAEKASELQTLIGGRTGTMLIAPDWGEIRIVVHPVTVAREDYAYLLVWQGREPVRSSELNSVEQAATVVALEIAKLRAVAEVEKRFCHSFIEDLIQGKIESRAEALARGELYGWDLSPGFTPLLVEIDDLRRLYLAFPGKREVAQVHRRVWETVAAAVTACAPESIPIDMGGRIAILFRPPKGKGRGQGCARAWDLASRILDGLGQNKGVTVSVGIGRYLDDILNLRAGFEQASQALEVGRVVNGPGSATDFDELGVYRILVDSKDRPELERFAHDLLGGLIASDSRGNSELVRTLEAVLRCNGNLKLAARELFVHYNTLRYRVTRIREITKIDLGSAEGRLNLQIAMKILRIAK